METSRTTLVSLFLLGSVLAPCTGSAQTPDDGQWVMPGKDYGSTRYSGLTQLTPANVTRLRPVWNFSTGVLRGHEGQPLVVNNTMYVVTPYPNVLYAFDLTQPDYPLKWKYRPMVDPNALGMACCDAINRGAFYADGKIVYNLLDGHTVAVDAVTGREIWARLASFRSMSWIERAPNPTLSCRAKCPSMSDCTRGVSGTMRRLDLVP